jgi:hypothetical protein
VSQQERWLIGFWLNHGLSRPGQSLCNWGRNSAKWRNFWSEDIQRRIINQLERIRHWTIIQGSYEDAPDIEGHWHIDPPYHNAAGRKYRFHPVDYDALAQWCVSRKGFRAGVRGRSGRCGCRSMLTQYSQVTAQPGFLPNVFMNRTTVAGNFDIVKDTSAVAASVCAPRRQVLRRTV